MVVDYLQKCIKNYRKPSCRICSCIRMAQFLSEWIVASFFCILMNRHSRSVVDSGFRGPVPRWASPPLLPVHPAQCANDLAWVGTGCCAQITVLFNTVITLLLSPLTPPPLQLSTYLSAVKFRASHRHIRRLQTREQPSRVENVSANTLFAQSQKLSPVTHVHRCLSESPSTQHCFRFFSPFPISFKLLALSGLLILQEGEP